MLLCNVKCLMLAILIIVALILENVLTIRVVLRNFNTVKFLREGVCYALSIYCYCPAGVLHFDCVWGTLG